MRGTKALRHEGTKGSALERFRLRACVPNRLRASRGFTLVEMLTTVAVLVVVLGMMVSLARDVRNRSANELTSEILTKLDYLMADYVKNNGGHLPVVTPLVSGGMVAKEESIKGTVWQSNEE